MPQNLRIRSASRRTAQTAQTAQSEQSEQSEQPVLSARELRAQNRHASSQENPPSVEAPKVDTPQPTSPQPTSPQATDEDVMEEEVPPVQGAAGAPVMATDAEAHKTILEMVRKDFPELYATTQSDTTIPPDTVVRVARKLLEEVERRALVDEVFTMMLVTNLSRETLLARTFVRTPTGRAIIYGVPGHPNEGVCLRPCCIGDNIIYTIRQLGGNAWRYGIDLLYQSLQAAYGGHPKRHWDADGIQQWTVVVGDRRLPDHRSTYPLVGVDISSCPRMSEVLSGTIRPLTRAGYVVVLPVGAPAPTTATQDTSAEGVGSSRTEQEQAVHDAAAEDGEPENELLKILAVVDGHITMQLVNTITKLANNLVHEEAHVTAAVTVVKKKFHVLSAAAPLRASDAALRAALMAQAEAHEVDVNLVPGASATCRLNNIERDITVVTNLALVKGPNSTTGDKLDVAPLVKNLMLADGEHKSGYRLVQVVLIEFGPMRMTGFTQLGGLVGEVGGDPRYFVQVPWAPEDVPKEWQYVFTNFFAWTMVRFLKSLADHKYDAGKRTRVSLLAGLTRNLGVAPWNNTNIAGAPKPAQWCGLCSGLKFVGNWTDVRCCCSGGESAPQNARKRKQAPNKRLQIKKLQNLLEFKNQGRAWVPKNSQLAVGVREEPELRASEMLTPDRGSLSGDLYEPSSEELSPVLWGNGDEDDEEDDDEEDGEENHQEDDDDDQVDDEVREDDGDAGPVNKYGPVTRSTRREAQ